LLVIYIKFSEIPNERTVKCGEKGEIPDKMIVDPRLREDDEEGGTGMTRGCAGMTNDDASGSSPWFDFAHHRSRG
jgi:hypothetical protein